MAFSSSGVTHLDFLETRASSVVLSIRNSGDEQEDQESKTEHLHIGRMRVTSDAERVGFS